LRDAVMGLRREKPCTQARPAIPLYLNKWICSIVYFFQYVTTHILNICKVIGYPISASLIILLDNSCSCSGESIVFLPNLDLLCLFSAKCALRILLGTL
jgi:hypothetical protein